MTTYARIVHNKTVDVCVTPPALEERFHPEWLAKQAFVVVPDGTLNGATDNGDGTFKNPPPPVPVFAANRLTRQDLRALVVQAFGGNGAAIVRLQTYIDTAATNVGTQPADKAMRYALQSLQQNMDFSLADADQIMTGLQFTAQDKAAVDALWPKIQVG